MLSLENLQPQITKLRASEKILLLEWLPSRIEDATLKLWLHKLTGLIAGMIAESVKDLTMVGIMLA